MVVHHPAGRTGVCLLCSTHLQRCVFGGASVGQVPSLRGARQRSDTALRGDPADVGAAPSV